jgi:hypothetical protein
MNKKMGMGIATALLFSLFNGCQKPDLGCMFGNCGTKPVDKKKEVSKSINKSQPETLKSFYGQAFENEKTMLKIYNYILTGNELPGDKVLLLPIETPVKSIIPDKFDFYADFKEKMGNLLRLTDEPKGITSMIGGSVSVENLVSKSGGIDTGGDNDKVKGSGQLSVNGSAGVYRIVMSVSWKDADGTIAAQVTNSINYSVKDSGFTFAISFLNFSLGVSNNKSRKESIFQTLTVLSDFSFLQLVGKNFGFPFWYAFKKGSVKNYQKLVEARHDIYEKYTYVLFPRLHISPYLIMRRALVKIWGVDPRNIRKNRNGKFSKKAPFSATEQYYINNIKKQILSNQSQTNIFRLTPQEKEDLLSSDPSRFVPMILLSINPLKKPEKNH